MSEYKNPLNEETPEYKKYEETRDKSKDGEPGQNTQAPMSELEEIIRPFVKTRFSCRVVGCPACEERIKEEALAIEKAGYVKREEIKPRAFDDDHNFDDPDKALIQLEHLRILGIVGLLRERIVAWFKGDTRLAEKHILLDADQAIKEIKGEKE